MRSNHFRRIRVFGKDGQHGLVYRVQVRLGKLGSATEACATEAATSATGTAKAATSAAASTTAATKAAATHGRGRRGSRRRGGRGSVLGKHHRYGCNQRAGCEYAEYLIGTFHIGFRGKQKLTSAL